MDFKTTIYDLQSKVKRDRKRSLSEAQTRAALIQPFISALGYDISNPEEVIPEATAAWGSKKDSKVDYAIRPKAGVEIIIECKRVSSTLSYDDAEQLATYFFNSDDAELAILTNGVLYKFYSDLDKKHKMDKEPFISVDMSEVKPDDVAFLENVTKAKFSIGNIVDEARNRKDKKLVRKLLEKELSQPSEKFVKLVLNLLKYPANKGNKKRFAEIISDTARNMRSGTSATPSPKPDPAPVPSPDSKPAPKPSANSGARSSPSRATLNTVMWQGKKVTFAIVFANGLIPVGTKISNHEWKEQATVLADGFVDYNGQRYSFSRFANVLAGGSRNAWDYLQYERADGSRVVLDDARQKMLRQSSESPSPNPKPSANSGTRSSPSKATLTTVMWQGKKVTFATVVASGLIPVGSKVSNRDWKEQATVRADGFVNYSGERYSVNQLAEKMSRRAVNAWRYLEYERADGSRVGLDFARQEFLGQSSQSPSPSSNLNPTFGTMPEDRQAFLASPPEQNGVTRPREKDSIGATIWIICGKFYNEHKQAPTGQQVFARRHELGQDFSYNTIHGHRGRWLEYWGLEK